MNEAHSAMSSQNAAEPAAGDGARAPMLRERAVTAFKERLFRGDLRPGQFLSQRELTLFLGLPLAPVRDAVRRLESEGLVRVIPQRGIAVAEVSLQFVRESFELRKALETWSVRRFAETGPVALLDALIQEVRALEAEVAKGLTPERRGRAILLDRRLHETIVVSLENQLLAEATRQTFDKIQLVRLVHPVTPDRLRRAFGEHLAILDALRRRDGEQAAAAMDAHLDSAMRHAIGIVD
ncbi:MAG: GntR family transcriptional regulator [Geminicoccaceae bacterium]